MRVGAAREAAPDNCLDDFLMRRALPSRARPPTRPSRSTVMRSVMVITSSMSCEMKMTLEPVAAIERIRSNSRADAFARQEGRRFVEQNEARPPLAAQATRMSSKARTMASKRALDRRKPIDALVRIEGRGRTAPALARRGARHASR